MFKSTNRLLAVAAITALGFSGAVHGQAAPSPAPAATDQPAQQKDANADSGHQVEHEMMEQLKQIQQNPENGGAKLFLLNTAVGSMFEIQYSEQVLQKAQSPQVKEVAQHIIADHQQMNEALMQVAKQVGVQPPMALPHMKQMEIQILTSAQGQELEQGYLTHMLAAHAKDVSEFQSVSRLCKVEAVKQFAATSLPKLQQHQQMVQQAAMAMGIPAQSAAEGVENRIKSATDAATGAGAPAGGSGANRSGTNGNVTGGDTK